MPNRIIKESICTSETVDRMNWFEECFFTRLWTACDDYGRMDARPAILKAKLFPLKERMTLKDIEGALRALADIGCVKLYDCDSRPYLYLPTWEVHQNIRAKKSKYPAPNSVNAHENICMQMQSDAIKCPRNPIQSVSESNPPIAPQGASVKKFVPPKVDEVAAYCSERANGIDAQEFCDFYQSKGWKVGNTPMKDWKAAVRTWERNRKERQPTSSSEPWGGIKEL